VWENLTSTASLPALAMHTMIVVEAAVPHLVIFGGRHSDGLSDGLFTLDLDDPNATWVDQTGIAHAPAPRFGHGAASVSGRLFIYGGWTQPGSEPDDGLYVLDMASMAWVSLTNLPGRPEYGRALFTMLAVSHGVSVSSVDHGVSVSPVDHGVSVSPVDQLGLLIASWGESLPRISRRKYFSLHFESLVILLFECCSTRVHTRACVVLCIIVRVKGHAESSQHMHKHWAHIPTDWLQCVHSRRSGLAPRQRIRPPDQRHKEYVA
jgi:hypothetical protein